MAQNDALFPGPQKPWVSSSSLRGRMAFRWGICVLMFAVSARAAPTGGEQKAPDKAASSGEEWTSEEPKPPGGRQRDPELGDPPETTETDVESRPSPLTPAPQEMPARPSLDVAEEADLLAALVALRARVNALTAALYESKLRIHLEADGEDSRIASLSVTVDGGVVYTAKKRFIGAEEALVYEHSVAPGRHVIGVEVERFDPRVKGYRAWQQTRYAVDVPEKRTLSARIELEDSSSMRDPTSGRYRLRSSLRVEVVDP